jgi:hypothetical protein
MRLHQKWKLGELKTNLMCGHASALLNGNHDEEHTNTHTHTHIDTHFFYNNKVKILLSAIRGGVSTTTIYPISNKEKRAPPPWSTTITMVHHHGIFNLLL